VELGNRVLFNATPTIFLNGRTLSPRVMLFIEDLLSSFALTLPLNHP
jgi:hypothetical protein